MTMNKRPNYWETIRIFEKIGIRYHDYGILRKGKVKYGDYYKMDKLDPLMKEELKRELGDWVEFKRSSKQFAPEIQSHMIVIISHHEMKERKSK